MVKFKSKSHQCPYCKMKYNKWGNILNHIKKKHNEVWIKDDWFIKNEIHLFGKPL